MLKVYMSTFQKLPDNFIVETLDECCILYNDKLDSQCCWSDYHFYIIDVLRTVIKEINSHHNKKINIILNHTHSFIEKYNFNNENNTLLFYINEEHTIISKGAIINNNKIHYNTKIIDYNNPNELYMITIQNPESVNNSDIVINYSATNHINCKISMDFKDVYKKMVLIHPLIYPYYNKIENRNVNCLTTFLYPNRTQKRLDFLNKIRENGIIHVNINTCYSAEDFISLYRNTKILINIHQTYEYHSVEELRILPALMCGVIVICEEGPLKEYIPYHDYIVWTTNENMIQTIRDVEQNYVSLHNKFFSGSRLSNLLEIMAESNKHELYDKIISKVL